MAALVRFPVTVLPIALARRSAASLCAAVQSAVRYTELSLARFREFWKD